MGAIFEGLTEEEFCAMMCGEPRMDREEVIMELLALMDGFAETHGAVPVCLEEAVRILIEVQD